MARLALEKVVVLLLVFVVAILVIVLLLKNVPVLKKAITSPFSEETNQTKILEGEPAFFSQFIEDYKKCKLSPSTDCFCQITFPSTSENHVMEIINNPSSKKTAVTLYSNAELSSCGTISPVGKLNTSLPIYIENDLAYFENVYTSPSIINTGEFNVPNFEDFTDVERLYLYKEELCTTKDVKGSDDIDFSKGILYKFDNERTAFLSENYNLRRCDSVPNIIEANEEFARLSKLIKECSQTQCAYPVKIPENFKFVVEEQQLKLKYKDSIIKSVNFEKPFCLFTHFSLTKREERDLPPAFDLSEYLQIDVYHSQDKICLLPYTEELAKEKQIALSREIINEPLIPLE